MTATATDGTARWAVVASIRVVGMPKPGGSKKAFQHQHTGRIVVTDDCKTTKTWRADVRNAALMEWGDRPLLDEPIRLGIVFILPRPKGHYGTGRNAGRLKPSAPAFPITKPDATKLLRSTEDALTDVVWRDDSRIVAQTVHKAYGEPTERPGAVITVETLTD